VSAPPGSSGLGAVVFTDIVGFTEYTATNGDERALALLDAQSRVVAEHLPAGARVVKELGDGLLLWFPDCPAALVACLDLRDGFEDTATEATPLWVRMGMHWGCPTERGDDLIGNDVNLASRIVDVAGPGELLLSEHARDAAGDGVEHLVYQELGPVVMKGIPDPVRLFRAERRMGRRMELSTEQRSPLTT
jgi:class 3 adenylate cyclase